jgi:hypothetical protein
MLLSINESKVAELLKSSNKGYTVSDVPLVIENSTPPYPATPEVSGTVYTAPVLVTADTKERLLDARRRIEESGVPLKGVEQLAREIDQMRGRR